MGKGYSHQEETWHNSNSYLVDTHLSSLQEAGSISAGRDHGNPSLLFVGKRKPGDEC